MIDDRSSPPPEPEACLDRAYPSTQKGGTLIAEDVLDLPTHEARLEAADGYRPAQCPRCGARLHAHDLRWRLLLNEAEVVTEIRRYCCGTVQGCGATWRILPAFLARHLSHTWAEVETAIKDPARSKVPARTRRRLRARLRSSAKWLIELLMAVLCGLGCAPSRTWTREELADAYRALCRPARGAALAQLAALIHSLEPGVRLM